MLKIRITAIGRNLFFQRLICLRLSRQAASGPGRRSRRDALFPERGLSAAGEFRKRGSPGQQQEENPSSDRVFSRSAHRARFHGQDSSPMQLLRPCVFCRHNHPKKHFEKGICSMKKLEKALFLVLFLSLALSLTGCASSTSNTITGSFEESEISFPRIVYFSRDSKKISDLYYIPISEETASMCQDILSNSIAEKIAPSEYVQLFQLEFDKDHRVTVFETLSGNHYLSSGAGISGFRADNAVEILLDRIEESTGCPTSIDLYDFKNATCVELVQDEKVIWSSDTQEVIKSMNTLLDAYQGSSVSNFDNYDFELCCTLTDGGTISLFLSSDDGYIFIPPLRYYKLPPESVLRTAGWPEVFGLKEWPAK